ncbi:hypothetical protein [Kitasatospora sp. GP82]|uniref:LppU/SCO3897 family protein n=1 Tax=Kitasatospora sp. GP82 TaxID=3035089 RepID=UPI00247477B1|nr:hypothetical protein [Kitasatospora sp. GP82]MDH6125436.1 hypothetical protein [Kitasatospora sp. GP82]
MSTPPPPNPFGGQPPGYPAAPPAGQPAYPGTPYGQQPPAAPYGQQPPAAPYGQQPPAAPYGQQPPAAPYGPPGYPTPPPEEKSRARRWTFRSVIGGTALVLAAFGLWITDNSPEKAHVGDCMHRSSRPSKVACSSPDANVVVVARYSGSGTLLCQVDLDSTSSYSGSYGRRYHKKKYVLCLAPHQPGNPAPTVMKRH